MLPLQMFEPRYRAMTEDVLRADRLLAVVFCGAAPDAPKIGDVPAVRTVACLAQLIHAEPLSSGGYAVLVQGLGRTRLMAELAADAGYRRFVAEPLDDTPAAASEQAAAARRLQAAVDDLAIAAAECDAQLVDVLRSQPEILALCDVLAAVLISDAAQQQRLLAATCPTQRLLAVEKVVRAQERRYRQPLGYAPQ